MNDRSSSSEHRSGREPADGYRLDLSSCWAKVHQAGRHRDALKGKVGNFFWEDAPVFLIDSNRVGIVAKLDTKTGQHIVRVATLPDKLLALLAMEVGDAVHNLRTSLDHLAWQLALEHYGGREPPEPREIYFPIATGPQHFARLKVMTHLDPARAKALRRFQPYNGADGRLIRTLNNLDIRDKHKLLLSFRLDIDEFTPFTCAAVSVRLFTKNASRRGINIGAKIMEVGFDPNDPHYASKMNSKLTPRVLLPGLGHPVEWLAKATVAVGRTVEAFS